MQVDNLLCIISEQHVPNVLSVLHFRPRMLHLLVTRQMDEQHRDESLLEALREAGVDYTGMAKRIPIESEDDGRSALRSMHAHAAAFRGGSWVVNISCGTKPLSAAAYAFGAETNGPIIYVNVNAPHEYVDQGTGERAPLTPRLSVAQFLAASGMRKLLCKATGREVFEASRVLAAHGQPAGYLDFSVSANDASGFADLLYCIDSRARARLVDKIQATGAERWLQARQGVRKFLEGDWLEYFVWGILDSARNALDIEDLYCGQEIAYFDPDAIGDSRAKDAAKATNELDVAFTRRNTFYWVECKSGRTPSSAKLPNESKSAASPHGEQKSKPPSVADVLYAIEGKSRMLRALGARSAYACWSKDIDAPQHRTRARRFGIEVVDRHDLARLAHASAGHDTATIIDVLAPLLG